MQATITLKDLLETYKLFMEGKLKHKNHDVVFSSEFLCHHIAEILVPKYNPAIHDWRPSGKSMNHGKVNNQFRKQWAGIFLNKNGDHLVGILEEWNRNTDFSPESIMGYYGRSYEWAKNYRLKCLEKALEINPDAAFEFTNFIRHPKG